MVLVFSLSWRTCRLLPLKMRLLPRKIKLWVTRTILKLSKLKKTKYCKLNRAKAVTLRFNQLLSSRTTRVCLRTGAPHQIIKFSRIRLMYLQTAIWAEETLRALLNHFAATIVSGRVWVRCTAMLKKSTSLTKKARSSSLFQDLLACQRSLSRKLLTLHPFFTKLMMLFRVSALQQISLTDLKRLSALTSLTVKMSFLIWRPFLRKKRMHLWILGLNKFIPLQITKIVLKDQWLPLRFISRDLVLRWRSLMMVALVKNARKLFHDSLLRVPLCPDRIRKSLKLASNPATLASSKTQT